MDKKGGVLIVYLTPSEIEATSEEKICRFGEGWERVVRQCMDI